MLYSCSINQNEPEQQEQQPVIEVYPEGAIKGKFSVSDTSKIYFSKGNLQYHGSIPCFSFASTQYEVYGYINRNGIKTAGDFDLFAYGTSGYNKCYPYKWSSSSDDFASDAMFIKGTNYDWGVYNVIVGGGSQKVWRCLTNSEMNYLIYNRNNATTLLAYAYIEGQDGLIILPDDWEKDQSLITLSMLTYENNKYVLSEDKKNVYTKETWKEIEDKGAVFLPSTGYSETTISGNDIVYVSDDGYYWLSTGSGYRYGHAFVVARRSNFLKFGVSNTFRRYHHAVRLVQNCE